MVTRLMESTYGDYTDGEFVGQKQSLIRKLIEEVDENVVEGRCTLLTSLINAKVEIGYFMSEEVVNLLYQLADKNIALGLKLIRSLIEAYNSDRPKAAQGDDPSSLRNYTIGKTEEEIKEGEMITVVKCGIEHLKPYVKQLIAETSSVSFGERIESNTISHRCMDIGAAKGKYCRVVQGVGECGGACNAFESAGQEEHVYYSPCENLRNIP
eukprot:TRINITY_DN12782_c0_g2_i1.p1 TRINITY_DN12782_c0_g2~~TRINITY_DN12782_c0_g2_i1.p1  ORF type:complete len:211 (-),score=16.86 TRINITY_DN12782_c0_g2_i1:662-1294(-)